MYTPEIFKVTNPKLIREFIRETGFATLISKGGAYPVATHIPLELEKNTNGEEVLIGHVSKANLQWHDFIEKPNVLAIFLSPIHSYISSSWYKRPDAPTWNYISVHVSGTIKLLDQHEVETSLCRLIDKYESASKHPVSWYFLPKNVQEQAKHIVGFEISIEKMEATFKLSQNRDNEDYVRIINQLRASGDIKSQLLADVMANRQTERTI